jgi:hypothetical protein
MIGQPGSPFARRVIRSEARQKAKAGLDEAGISVEMTTTADVPRSAVLDQMAQASIGATELASVRGNGLAQTTYRFTTRRKAAEAPALEQLIRSWATASRLRIWSRIEVTTTLVPPAAALAAAHDASLPDLVRAAREEAEAVAVLMGGRLGSAVSVEQRDSPVAIANVLSLDAFVPGSAAPGQTAAAVEFSVE